MKHILVIGAGRSASSLIQYLLHHAGDRKWKITVGDVSLALAEEKIKGHPSSRAIALDIRDVSQREKEIGNSDLVISMLPASMHLEVAEDCVRLRKHLVTASYVSKEIGALNEQAKKAGVVLLNESGLDPGIDHMSAMQVIDRIHEQGGEFISFRSYCGGLVAPENNDNPWGYKFSWNPRNVILAGQGTAQYISEGTYRYIPYNRLFLQTEELRVEGYGMFEAYANRDSLSYRKPYRLENIPTMLRGTLRMPGYCNAWNIFVKLGLTDDFYHIQDSEKLTYRELLEAFLPAGPGTLRDRLIRFMGTDLGEGSISRFDWLEIVNDQIIGLTNASPAMILQQLLEEKWKLQKEDKDMIVMQHQFEYRESKTPNSPVHLITSSLVVKGEDQTYTAMAKTVGLPVAIAAGLILDGKIRTPGVCIPTTKEIYEPVMKELESLGIHFTETHS